MGDKKRDMERLLEAMDKFKEGDEGAFEGMTIVLDAGDKEVCLGEDS